MPFPQLHFSFHYFTFKHGDNNDRVDPEGTSAWEWDASGGRCPRQPPRCKSPISAPKGELSATCMRPGYINNKTHRKTVCWHLSYVAIREQVLAQQTVCLAQFSTKTPSVVPLWGPRSPTVSSWFILSIWFQMWRLNDVETVALSNYETETRLRKKKVRLNIILYSHR